MASQISELFNQWRENPRLRFGVLIMIVIVAIYVFLFLEDIREKQEVEYQQEIERYQRMQAIAEQQYWPERAEQARSQRVQLQTGLWRAESQGLAQAALQSWLKRKLHKLKLDTIKYDVAAVKPVPGINYIWQVPAHLKGALQLEQLIELLSLIELNKDLVRIEQLEIHRSKTAFRLDMAIAAYSLAFEKAGESD
ncbi:MAG: hypothetical protein U9N50_04515 [Pseudomonadota bacterium]|nr:hypothetical protein [Pseudomonadota bacterium]